MTFSPHRAAQQPDTRRLPRRAAQPPTGPSRPAHLPTPEDLHDPRPPQPAGAAARHELVRRLGLPTEAHPDFDDFARDMAGRTGFLYGFVNLFLDQQTFIGLHQPAPDSGYVTIGRTMSTDHGWCPEVMHRRKALPLHDVHASPRFSSNHIVDAVGIRSYFGAPLIHDSGIVLGTVCVIDPVKRSLGEARRLRDIVIDTGNQVMRRITDASGP